MHVVLFYCGTLTQEGAMTARQVTFTDRVSLPAIGQRTWHTDGDSNRHRDGVSALQVELDLGP